ncbi:MAG TPA: hypothetical protein VGR11_13665 [Solirubrobacteraceae bacterium]|nr:hypothetical protein [Solirubrobacteraceae bacterium]
MTRKGVLVVIGKVEIQREVPLNALVRQVLDEWLEQRKDAAATGERALFVSRTGGRLSARSTATCGSSPPPRGSSCRRTRCATRV